MDDINFRVTFILKYAVIAETLCSTSCRFLMPPQVFYVQCAAESCFLCTFSVIVTCFGRYQSITASCVLNNSEI